MESKKTTRIGELLVDYVKKQEKIKKIKEAKENENNRRISESEREEERSR